MGSRRIAFRYTSFRKWISNSPLDLVSGLLGVNDGLHKTHHRRGKTNVPGFWRHCCSASIYLVPPLLCSPCGNGEKNAAIPPVLKLAKFWAKKWKKVVKERSGGQKILRMKWMRLLETVRRQKCVASAIAPKH